MKVGLIDVDSHNYPNLPLMPVCLLGCLLPLREFAGVFCVSTTVKYYGSKFGKVTTFAPTTVAGNVWQ